MEHLQHFDLRTDPFSIDSDLRAFFEAGAHRDALCRLDRGLRQHKGLLVLRGENGTGKTLVARRILNDLEEEVFEASLMVMLPGAAEAGSVLTRFARQLGVEEPGQDRGALMAQIYDMLAAIREEGRHCAVMLDDAHLLPASHLAELCGLLSLEYEERRLMSLLLVGAGDGLDALLVDAGLDARIDLRVTLRPLDAESTRGYLVHRLQLAGGRPDVLSPEAVEELVRVGAGRPRLLNTLADNALFEAFLAQRAAVGGSDVVRAARDLGVEKRTPDASASPEIASRPLQIDGLDASSQANGDDDFHTLLVDPDDDETSSTLDLDHEVDAVLDASRDGAGLPAFQGQNQPGPGLAEPTRITLPDDGPPKDDAEELDDLFVELIED